jgi:hypothetical protein
LFRSALPPNVTSDGRGGEGGAAALVEVDGAAALVGSAEPGAGTALDGADPDGCVAGPPGGADSDRDGAGADPLQPTAPTSDTTVTASAPTRRTDEPGRQDRTSCSVPRCPVR